MYIFITICGSGRCTARRTSMSPGIAVLSAIIVPASHFDVDALTLYYVPTPPATAIQPVIPRSSLPSHVKVYALIYVSTGKPVCILRERGERNRESPERWRGREWERNRYSHRIHEPLLILSKPARTHTLSYEIPVHKVDSRLIGALAKCFLPRKFPSLYTTIWAILNYLGNFKV